MAKIYQWGSTTRYNSFTEYLKKRFGGRIQKLSINAGFTCPNRDGSKGNGGCIYCDNNAFNPSYCDSKKSITLQLKEGIEFHNFRYRRAIGYIAYFQAYTNTYATTEKLKQLFEEALNFPGIIGLSIGTRPDCVNDEILDYLGYLNKNYFISVEYGVESCYDDTLARLNRGHAFKDSADAIIKTGRRGINTGIHLIFGLPGESREKMLDEAVIISGLPFNSIKFHQLQILRNTKMEVEFKTNKKDFEKFSLETYIDFIISFCEKLSPSIMIDRFISEIPPRFISGESWGLIRYDEILRMIIREFENRNTWQGRLF